MTFSNALKNILASVGLSSATLMLSISGYEDIASSTSLECDKVANPIPSAGDANCITVLTCTNTSEVCRYFIVLDSDGKLQTDFCTCFKQSATPPPPE